MPRKPATLSDRLNHAITTAREKLAEGDSKGARRHMAAAWRRIEASTRQPGQTMVGAQMPYSLAECLFYL